MFVNTAFFRDGHPSFLVAPLCRPQPMGRSAPKRPVRGCSTARNWRFRNIGGRSAAYWLATLNNVVGGSLDRVKASVQAAVKAQGDSVDVVLGAGIVLEAQPGRVEAHARLELPA